MYNISMAIADETSWVSYGLTYIHKVFGFNNNAEDDRYIQFHAKPAALIANGDVPALKSLWAPAAAGFSYPVETEVSELSIAISSTEALYTAVTNTGLDLTAVVDSSFLVKNDTTLVGDAATGVSARTIWSDASGPKRLLALSVINDSGAAVYPAIRASTSRITNDTTAKILSPIESSFTEHYKFGGGYIPFRAGPTAATVHDGCFIEYRLTGVYTADDEAATDLKIYGVYGNV